MKEKIDKVLEDIRGFNGTEPDEFRRLFTGRKGVINSLFEDFKALPGPQKAEFGKVLNALKQEAQEKLDSIEKAKKAQARSASAPEDMTLPGDPHTIGARHPISITMNRIIGILEKVGFSIAYGPDIEDGWHNFDALNMPETHPARDMQDTFFIQTDPEILLRTHTSNIQIRVMESQKPPIRILAPGRCFRNETVSARSHVFFHQVEGLYIDEGVNFPDLMRILDYFAKQMFGVDSTIRLRPSYFPFTEISAEMDVSCMVCGGDGCQLCKYTGWVEIMGCGMVDPNVLENCKIDPDKYSGYAFGMGVERIAQLLYRIPDLRLYSQNDLRLLQQFQTLNP